MSDYVKSERLDFVTIVAEPKMTKAGTVVEVYASYSPLSKYILFYNGEFQFYWDMLEQRWCSDRLSLCEIIDSELFKVADEAKVKYGTSAKYNVHLLNNSKTRAIDDLYHYLDKQLVPRDAIYFNQKVIFNDHKIKMEDFATFKLPYTPVAMETPNYDKLMSTLYDDDNRHKIEYFIGALGCNKTQTLQKFMVLYGEPGTGKSTIIKLFRKLFDGYGTEINIGKLCDKNDQFGGYELAANPLLAYQDDGDLASIKTYGKLNTVVSHEPFSVNQKNRKPFDITPSCFMIMGTNSRVDFNAGANGLSRRLVDVYPTGNKLKTKEYNTIMKKLDSELAGIMYKCMAVYNVCPTYYDHYVPVEMEAKSNVYLNFLNDKYPLVKEKAESEDGVSLTWLYHEYLEYCEEISITYKSNRMQFEEGIKTYFAANNFERARKTHEIKRLYGLRDDKLHYVHIIEEAEPEPEIPEWLQLREQPSEFDKLCANNPAQYAIFDEEKNGWRPEKKWENCTTTLKDIDTSKVHHVKVPEEHILIDIDAHGEGQDLNFSIAQAIRYHLPPTYTEASKSGNGLHLHYIYNGDVNELAAKLDLDKAKEEQCVEIKVYKGNGSIRRRLSICNSLAVAVLSGGCLPRKEKKMVDKQTIENERHLHTMLEKCLNKEFVSGSTIDNISFAKKLLDDAYESGMHYDEMSLFNDFYTLAHLSSNSKDRCLKLFTEMKWQSADCSIVNDEELPLAWFDTEVFKNVLIMCYLVEEEEEVQALVNPEPWEVEKVMKSYNLIGFNCLNYDNHILWALAVLGYKNMELYHLSKALIKGDKQSANSKGFREAGNVSYVDCFDLASMTKNERTYSLKQWELVLGIPHVESEPDWDEPLPEEKWAEEVEYCKNDVRATKALFEHLKGEFTARKILAQLSGLPVNRRNNAHTTKIIFGNERHPDLVYTDLSKLFPGYEFVDGKNMYRGTDLGMGGYVYAEPGRYHDVALLDVASLHPHSIIAMNCFGKYTQRFKDLLDARIYIKHKEFDKARTMLDGQLAPFLEDEGVAKDLCQALKIAINSVYGLTSATFDNPFKDPLNVNNIVALRGALFMRTLQDEVVARGFTVAHIKTDSIKIPDATPEIIDFCMQFANKYGYTFEHEATYEVFDIVNNAVYIAKYAGEEAEYHMEEISCMEKIQTPWTATGTQFKVPYVFKKLFAKAELHLSDYILTKNVTNGAKIYVDYNSHLPDVSAEEKELEKLTTKFKKGLIDEQTYSEAKERLDAVIATGHDYHFIGKVGNFIPVKKGGGALYRVPQTGGYFTVTGTKGYKWIPAELFDGNMDNIDLRYFDSLCDEAIEALSQHGPFNDLINGVRTNKIVSMEDWMNVPYTDEEALPFV